MKITTRLLLTACLVLPFLGACKKEEAPKEAEKPALTMPATNDENAWNTYLTDVVTRNVEGASATYVYVLPPVENPEFQGYYDRQLEKAQEDIERGVLANTLIAFGSPNSAKSADLAVAAFSKAQPGKFEGVRVIFIGSPADDDRVKAAVAPSGAAYKFIEAK
ncbi:MAG TPA: hypothetical protein VGQ93_15780 [Lysobacter sp.]|jgi:hypothetical protein|nr:hypothetical protein [Lysobacter sp.]